ncbi:hypothetical protein MKW92_040304 [Papaver armeniacum]|nr:hypothetical protein MKW92_040304 [Papaver armeniacum]
MVLHRLMQLNGCYLYLASPLNGKIAHWPDCRTCPRLFNKELEDGCREDDGGSERETEVNLGS